MGIAQLYPTPTATLDGTATPTPATPIPTSDIEGIDLEAPEFPVPTGIAPLDFGTPSPAREFTPIPAPTALSIELTPWATPNYPVPALTPAATVTLAAVDSTISISYTAPLTISFEGTTSISGTEAISGLVDFTDDLISYTHSITSATADLQGSETITVVNAPEWYAPTLPRPLADVGWTFEFMTDPEGDTVRFTYTSWAGFFGYVSSLPFQFVKSLWQLVAYFGAFGLFLAWLLIMAILVAGWWGFVHLVRLVIMTVRFIKQLWELIPMN
ncbi:MAG: hypothetical protein HC875_29230 [Anaerolineales bacterium]|nr:hypothetical protein [Anaerolineales bacterium]